MEGFKVTSRSEDSLGVWLPIETAPKDGTVIDLWLVDETGCGWREANAYYVTRRPYDQYTADSPLRDGWFGPNHDYEGEAGWADHPDDRDYPVVATHWMPLPEPPKREPNGSSLKPLSTEKGMVE